MQRDSPRTESCHVCVVGLGFVGLPLAIQFWRSGIRVTGIDTDSVKIQNLLSGTSYLNDVPDAEVAALVASDRFVCTQRFDPIANADAVIVCVPTPLNTEGYPDLTYVLEASRSIRAHLRRGQLFVLESSTFPGTTEEYVVPVLATSGLKAGVDIYVAYSPERINPGDPTDIRKIPKVVGGINKASLQAAVELYSRVFEQVVPVSSTRVAELAKLLENTQRFVNISLMNELAILCRGWGISIWETIEAAATKPYGFTPYYPGPGVGGHCIPVDPMYLQWYASQGGEVVQFIKLAREINERMPRYVAERVLELTPAKSPRVLLVGLTYKRDVNDLRESAAVRVLEELLRSGAEVEYFDPYVPAFTLGDRQLASIALVPKTIRGFDVVAILTDHHTVDYDVIRKHARAILDTRNVYRSSGADNVHSL